MVPDHQSAFDRGHLTAHRVRQVIDACLLLLQAKTKEARYHFLVFEQGFLLQPPSSLMFILVVLIT